MKRLIAFVFLLLSFAPCLFAQTAYARMLSGVNLQSGNYLFVPLDSTRLTVFQSSGSPVGTLLSGTNSGFGIGTIFSVANYGPGTATIACSSCLIYSTSSTPTSSFSLTAGQGADIYSNGGNYYAQLGAGPGGSGGPAYYQYIEDPDGFYPQESRLNLVDGTNVAISCADDSFNNSTDCTFSATGGGGTGPTLQTNGVTNDTQSLLNLTHGANVKATYFSGGDVQLDLQPNLVINNLSANVFADTGTATAYAGCPSTTIPVGFPPGIQIQFIAAHTNTGSATFNLCSNGAATIVRDGGSNIASGAIVGGGLYSLEYTLAQNWQLLNPSTCATGCGTGTVNGQVNGQFTIGTGATSINTTAGAQLTSKQSGSDLCTRIRNAFAACATTSACHVIIDEGGKQFCNVQPFQSSSGGNYAGFAEVWSNGTALNLWLDGISTIQHGSGFIFDGHGVTGSSAGSSGGSSNMNFVICNPALMTCPSGGFAAQTGTITATSYSSNTLHITLSGAPFITCQVTGVCHNGVGTTPANAYMSQNPPASCDNGTSSAAKGCVNALTLYRRLCIYGSSVANNNGCFLYKTTNTFSGNQVFTMYSQSGLSNCSSSCGTAYLDTPAIIDGYDGGSGGTYESEIRNFTVEGQFFPGSEGFVFEQGEELTEGHRIQVFNTTADFYRFDQSSAYGGAPNGDTNSGPFGPFSGNFHNATCQLSGGCACNNAGPLCSGGKTSPASSFVDCSGGGANFAWLSPDPCLNPNFVGATFTGGGGNQGPSVVFHQTLSISDLSGSSLPGPSGSGVAQGSGFACYGSQCHFDQTHEEYFPTGFSICPDNSRNSMWYQAYSGVQTSGILLEGGLNGSNTGVYFDIGDANTTYGSNNICAGIRISMVFGGVGGSGTLTDNVTGHNMNFSTDAPVDFFLGTGNNPPVRTSEGGGGFSGPIAFPPGACAGAVGGSASTNYGLPPYTKTTTSIACTNVNVLGIPSPHAAIIQNLYCTVGTAPSGTLTCTVKDVTTPNTMTCTIAASATSCYNTTMSTNFQVSQGDLVEAYYSVNDSSDSATDVRMMWDAW